jgi:hypothetical protein
MVMPVAERSPMEAINISLASQRLLDLKFSVLQRATAR